MTFHSTAPPVLVAIAGVFLTLAFWRALERTEAQAYQTLLDARAGAFKNEISARGEARAYALLRMAKRWEQRRSPVRSQWIPDASLYVKHYPSYRALLWVDRDWSPRWWVERNSDQRWNGKVEWDSHLDRVGWKVRAMVRAMGQPPIDCHTVSDLLATGMGQPPIDGDWNGTATY